MCFMLQGAQTTALRQPRGMGWERGLERRGHIYIYLWLIHVYVWQRPAQYYKAIILQGKKKKEK